MRNIIVLSFISLDGVMQAPGGPEEDPSDGFKYGGWTVPYFDEALGNVMGEQMTGPFALLLGRKTFDIFASYWPEHADDWPGVNEATKYVVSNTLASPAGATLSSSTATSSKKLSCSRHRTDRRFRYTGAATSFRPC